MQGLEPRILDRAVELHDAHAPLALGERTGRRTQLGRDRAQDLRARGAVGAVEHVAVEGHQRLLVRQARAAGEERVESAHALRGDLEQHERSVVLEREHDVLRDELGEQRIARVDEHAVQRTAGDEVVGNRLAHGRRRGAGRGLVQRGLLGDRGGGEQQGRCKELRPDGSHHGPPGGCETRRSLTTGPRARNTSRCAAPLSSRGRGGAAPTRG
jgi:hypothetical protein